MGKLFPNRSLGLGDVASVEDGYESLEVLMVSNGIDDFD